MKTKINLLGHCCITIVLLIGLIGCPGSNERGRGDEPPVNSEAPSKANTPEAGKHSVDDELDELYIEYEERSPHQAYLLSVSGSRPAEVTIGWKHDVANGCDSAGGVAAQRIGNTIYLTIIYARVFMTCTAAVVVHTGQFTVKNLEAGEYIIKGKDENAEELGRFRIIGDGGYIEYAEGSPHQAYLLSISESRPAEVTIGWKYAAGNGCETADGVAAQRIGNTIYLTIRVGEFFEVICPQLVVVRTGQFTVKNLVAGEYIIRGKDESAGELGRFRIE